MFAPDSRSVLAWCTSWKGMSNTIGPLFQPPSSVQSRLVDRVETTVPEPLAAQKDTSIKMEQQYTVL
jgi:hypothetical protein